MAGVEREEAELAPPQREAVWVDEPCPRTARRLPPERINCE